jgi:hypothetical protein
VGIRGQTPDGLLSRPQQTLASRFGVRPASPLIGAEIEGVDLTLPVDKATAEALRETFWTYL